MTTREELRNAVHKAIFFGDAKTTEERADAAIKVVLGAALMAPVNDPGKRLPERDKAYLTGHTNGIQDKCDAIRALMPETEAEA